MLWVGWKPQERPLSFVNVESTLVVGWVRQIPTPPDLHCRSLNRAVFPQQTTTCRQRHSPFGLTSVFPRICHTLFFADATAGCISATAASVHWLLVLAITVSSKISRDHTKRYMEGAIAFQFFAPSQEASISSMRAISASRFHAIFNSSKTLWFVTAVPRPVSAATSSTWCTLLNTHLVDNSRQLILLAGAAWLEPVDSLGHSSNPRLLVRVPIAAVPPDTRASAPLFCDISNTVAYDDLQSLRPGISSFLRIAPAASTATTVS